MGDRRRHAQCEEQLRLWENAGMSHESMCGETYFMSTAGLIPTEDCDEMLRMLQLRSSTASSEYRPCPTAESTLTGQSYLQTRANVGSQTVLDVRVRSPTEASGCEQIQNGAFNVSSPPTSTAARLNPMTPGPWLRRCLGKLIPTISRSPRNLTRNKFLLHITVERPDGTIEPGMALFDTGSDYTILGPRLVQFFYPNLDTRRATLLAKTEGGGRIRTLGAKDVRWSCLDTRFRPKFETSMFHMSVDELSVDAIIGWRLLLELGLVSLNMPGHVSMISQPPDVDRTTATRVQAAADARRQAENDEMRRDELNRNYEQQRRTHAQNQAIRYANDYADEHRALHGETGLQQACQAKYSKAYRQIYDAYPQYYPRSVMQ
ncbi:hypothetical protein P171DRAFT_72765 [Karstenula rhodostoma CBS 690.94]|uniref:Uncharacterized protein n=1 Tax=Karstenula rhodostoma CBS 690.94 TaxID=1392251 RepID=A0A9P4U7Q2_9PLEO|nr:hypothetical protein P171DRAFT_72765 [Karstenula rhodostoma CBS 690.94]